MNNKKIISIVLAVSFLLSFSVSYAEEERKENKITEVSEISDYAYSAVSVLTGSDAINMQTESPEAKAIEIIDNVWESSEEDSPKVKDYALLKGLGIIDNDMADSKSVSRGAFAAILVNLTGSASNETVEIDWEESFFGEFKENTDLIIKASKGEKYFKDVDETTDYFKEIEFAAVRGLIDGINDEMFAPEDEISYNQAVKSIVTVLGYKAEAIINGYEKTAYNIGFLDSKTGNRENFTKENLFAMIENALEADIMKSRLNGDSVSYEISYGSTIISEYLNLEMKTGIMTDNGITGIYSETEAPRGSVIVGGERYNNADKFTDFLGYEVEVFYNEDNEAVCIIPTRKNITREIRIADFHEYRDNTITVYGQNGRYKKYRLEKHAPLIMNGVYYGSYDNDIFLYECGEIVIVDNNNDGVYDALKCEKYETWVSGGYNSETEVLYNKAFKKSAEGQDNKDRMLKLSDAIENNTLWIYDTQGNELDLSDIKPGSVLDIAKSNNIIKIIVSDNKTEAFKIKTLIRDEEKSYVTDSVSEYPMLNSYFEFANAPEILLNTNYTLYFNSFNMVSWIEEGSVSHINVAYMIKAYEDYDEEDSIYIKCFDMNGTVNTYKCAERVKFSDDGREYSKYNGLVLKGFIEKYKGLFIFETNSNGEISLIELPSDSNEEDGHLCKFFDSGNVSYKYVSDGLGRFNGDSAFIASDVKVITVPKDEAHRTDESKYSIASKSVFKTDSSYSGFSAFTTKKDSRLAEYIVYESESKKELGYAAEDSKFMVVTDVLQTLDDDGTPCIKICGYYGGYSQAIEYRELYCLFDAYEDAEGNLGNPAENAYDIPSKCSGMNSKYTIRGGDIIRYSYQRDAFYPDSIELVFRSDAKSPAFPEGVNGILAGTTGVFDKDLTPAKNNPIALNGSNSLISSAAANPSTRIYYGWALSNNSGLIRCTTEDVTINNSFDENFGGGRYVEGFIPLGGTTKIISITYDGKHLNVADGTVSAVKTFEESYADCSRVLVHSNNNYIRTVFVINGSYNNR